MPSVSVLSCRMTIDRKEYFSNCLYDRRKGGCHGRRLAHYDAGPSHARLAPQCIDVHGQSCPPPFPLNFYPCFVLLEATSRLFLYMQPLYLLTCKLLYASCSVQYNLFQVVAQVVYHAQSTEYPVAKCRAFSPLSASTEARNLFASITRTFLALLPSIVVCSPWVPTATYFILLPVKYRCPSSAYRLTWRAWISDFWGPPRSECTLCYYYAFYLLWLFPLQSFVFTASG